MVPATEEAVVYPPDALRAVVRTELASRMAN